MNRANFMKMPSSIGIETVNYCNSKCIFCPLFRGNEQIDRSIRPEMIMKIDLFTKIIDEIASWAGKPDTIYLNMDGEPLLDPLLKERLFLLKNRNICGLIDLQTNAEFLTESISAALIQCGVRRVTIGFDGATKAVYEMHRTGCSYQNVLHNIREFIKIRDKLNGRTGIAIQYVRTKKNMHEVLDAYNMFCKILSPSTDCFYDTLSKRWGGSPEEYVDIVIENLPDTDKSIGCPALETQMIILADGKVASCCWDYNLSIYGPLGDVNQDSLFDVWNGLKFQSLRNLLNQEGNENKPPKCLTCVYPRKKPSMDIAAIEDRRLVQPAVNGFHCSIFRSIRFNPEQSIPLKGPFQREHGYAWQANLYAFASEADNPENPRRSSLVLLENGQPLRFRHALHDKIRNEGRGLYSHWRDVLFFATSDNSDPNINGRLYQIVFTDTAD